MVRRRFGPMGLVLALLGAMFPAFGATAFADTQCAAVCYVDAAAGSDANGGDTIVTAKGTIQAAVNQVSSGGTIRVLPGTYDESASDSAPTGLGGTYQFGLFFGSGKPGITLMGVTPADVPITNAAAVQARITTNATNNFGFSGIFVEAADTTIQGVEIGPNAAGDNKTIEVVADNFTLRHARTDIPNGGGSIYINDFSAAGDVVQAYHVLDNLFPDGTSIDISSGAGKTGPVSGRVITGNDFNLVGGNWNAISFNGSDTGVAWFVNTVGGAVITGNTFAGGTTQYIRARGTYDNSQFDWESFWSDNTFDRAAIALVTESPFEVRTFSYTSGSYVFDNVRRIGPTIQGEVDTAHAGDTVLVAPGTYAEDVVVAKANLTLRGAGMDLSTIVGPKGNAALNTLEVSAGGAGATIDGFTFTRDGNTAGEWTTALNNQGVAIYGAGSTLENSRITGNRNGVFLYGAQNVTIRNNTIDFNRTGIHLVNDVSGLAVRNNFITGNWTMGVLFRDEGSPNTTGTVTITENSIAGNWYSQIEARSLFSAPDIDAEQNWLGTILPSVAAAPSSGEPGYTAQIPVAYGGSSVPPVTAPTVVYNGVNLVNPLDYTPYLCSGTDASTEIGFQPFTGTGPSCYAFGGFRQPVDAGATNLAKAGQTIPVKWRLLDTNGQPVSSPSSFVGLTSRQVSCSTLADEGADQIETYATNTGLSYQGDGNWQFNWATPKTYANTCRIMTLTLSDGTSYSADFQFKLK